MKKIMEKLKQYTPIAGIVGASLVGGGAYAQGLPIDSQARENMRDRQEQVYVDSLSSAKAQFSEYIQDGKFTIDEQEKVYKALDFAKNYAENTGKEFPEAESKLHELVYGDDYYDAKGLEESLAQEGLSVEVESQEIDVAIKFLYVAGLTIAGAGLGIYLGRRIEKLNTEKIK